MGSRCMLVPDRPCSGAYDGRGSWYWALVLYGAMRYDSECKSPKLRPVYLWKPSPIVTND